MSALASSIIISSEAEKATAPFAIAPSGNAIAAAGILRILAKPPPPTCLRSHRRLVIQRGDGTDDTRYGHVDDLVPTLHESAASISPHW